MISDGSECAEQTSYYNYPLHLKHILEKFNVSVIPDLAKDRQTTIHCHELEHPPAHLQMQYPQ
jgi:hypothetical protein